MKRRLVGIVLAICMLVSMLPISAMAAGASNFADMPSAGHWSYAALSAAVENGLLQGSGGKLLPKEALTRAQMAAILGRAFGATAQADISRFTDVRPAAWYYDDVAKAVEMGLFQGDTNNAMRPDDFISRQEAFTVLARAFHLEEEALSVLDRFTDKGSVSSYAKGSLAAMVKAGYVNGSGGKLNPKSSITREEFAQVMYNMISAYFTTANTYTSAPAGTLVIRAAGVTLKGVTVSGDLIIGDSAVNTVLDGVTVTGRILMRCGGTLTLKGVTAPTLVAAGSGAAITADKDSAVTIFDAQANGVSVTAESGTVSVRAGISGVTANGEAVSGGASAELGGQSSGGGGGGGGGTPPATTVNTTAMTVSPASQILAAGSYAANAYTVTRNTGAADAITWASSDESIAVVDSTGKVGAKKAGEVTITAMSASGVIATATVIVREPYQINSATTATISVPGTVLSGGTYTAVTVAESVGTGDYTLENVNVTTLTTNAGGSHSGYIEGGSVDSLNVANTPADGSRIVLTGGTVVGSVTVSDNATIETPAGESASVGNVTAAAATTLTGVDVQTSVTADGAAVTLNNTTAPTVTTSGTSTVTVDSASTVNTVAVVAGTTTIAGSGTVSSVTASGTVTTNVPVGTIAASGSATVTANTTVGSVTGTADSVTLNNTGATSVAANASKVTVEGTSAPVVSGTVPTVEVKADATGSASVTVTGSVSSVTATGTGTVGAVNVGGNSTATVTANTAINTVTVSDTAAPKVSGTAAVGTVISTSTGTTTVSNANAGTVLAQDSDKVSCAAVVQTVTVTLKSIAVTGLPARTEYKTDANTALNLSGLAVTGYYEISDFEGTVSKAVTVARENITGWSDTNANSAGAHTLTVTIGGKTAAFAVTAVAKTVRSIAVAAVPTVKTYDLANGGQVFSAAGAKLTVNYTSALYAAETVNITNAMCGGYALDTEGSKTVTVTYGGKTAAFTVTVIDSARQALELAKSDAGSALANHVTDKLLANTYSAAGKAELLTKRDAGLTAIRSAETADAVTAALTNAKAAVDTVKTQEGEWTASANAYKLAHAAVLAKTTENIAVADKAGVNAALVVYAGLEAGVQAKLTAQKALLDSLLAKIATLEAAQTLDAAKTSARSTLSGAKANYDTGYTANGGAVTDAYNSGVSAINAATATAAVTAALDRALAAMAAVKSDAVVLTEAKTAAVAVLNAYLPTGRTLSDYDTAAKGDIDAARKAGVTAINAAATTAAVTSALNTAKSAVDAVKTIAVKLADAKTAAITELNAYKNDSLSLYRTAQQTAISTAKTNGTNAINAATTYGADAAVTTSVAYALKAAKAAIDAVKTDAQLTAEELAAAKTAAKAELNTAYAAYAAGYTVNYNSITAAKIAGVTNIEAAATTDAVTSAKTTAVAAMRAFDSDAVVLTKAQTANAALAATAKSAAAGAAYTAVQQTSCANEAAAKTYAENIAKAAVNNAAVTVTVNSVGYTAPIAGDEDDADGTNGTYSFTVTLTAGKVESYGSTVKAETTAALTLTITATAFDGTTNATHVANAKTAVESASYTAAQAGCADEAAALAKVQELVAAAKNNAAVTATVNKVSYTAPVSGSASDLDGTGGSYVFTVTLTKGGASKTTANLTLTITATAMSAAPTGTISGMETSYTAPYDTDITLTAPTGANYAYQWQKKTGSGEFADISGATGATYTITDTVHYADNGTQYQVKITNTESGKLANIATLAAVTLTVLKGSQSAPDAPTLAFRTTASVTLNGRDNAEFKCGDGSWQDSSVFTGLNAGTSYTFYVRLKETSDLNASAASNGTVIYTVPAAPATTAVTIDYAAETVSYANTLELFASDKTTAIASGSITAYIGTTVYVRVKASGSAPVSDWTAIAIPARPAAPTVGFTAVTISGNDGTITGAADTMEYKLSSATAYTSVTGTSVTGLSAGEYKVRVKATTGAFASPDATVTMTAITTAQVTSLAELTAAIGNNNVLDITVSGDFTVTGTVTTTKPVTVAEGKTLTNLGTLSVGSLTVNGAVINGSADGAENADVYAANFAVTGSFTNNPGSVLRIATTASGSGTVTNLGYLFNNASAITTTGTGVTGTWTEATGETLAAALSGSAYGVWLTGNATISADTTISKYLTVAHGATLTVSGGTTTVSGEPAGGTAGDYTCGYGAIRVGGTLAVSSGATLTLGAAGKASTGKYTANSAVVCGVPGGSGTLTNAGTLNLAAGTYNTDTASKDYMSSNAQGGVLSAWNMDVTNTGTLNNNYYMRITNSTFTNSGTLTVKPSSVEYWMPDAGWIDIGIGGTYKEGTTTIVGANGIIKLLAATAENGDTPAYAEGSVYISGVPKDALKGADYKAPFLFVAGNAELGAGAISDTVASNLVSERGSLLTVKGTLNVGGSFEVRGEVVIQSGARVVCPSVFCTINYVDFNPENGIDNVGMLIVEQGGSYKAGDTEYVYDATYTTGLFALTGTDSKLMFTGCFFGDENSPFLFTIGAVTMKHTADLTDFYMVNETGGTLTIDSGVTLTEWGFEVRGTLINNGTIYNGKDDHPGGIKVFGGATLTNTGTITGVWHDDENSENTADGWYDSSITLDFSFANKTAATLTNSGTINDLVYVNQYLADTEGTGDLKSTATNTGTIWHTRYAAVVESQSALERALASTDPAYEEIDAITRTADTPFEVTASITVPNGKMLMCPAGWTDGVETTYPNSMRITQGVTVTVADGGELQINCNGVNAGSIVNNGVFKTAQNEKTLTNSGSITNNNYAEFNGLVTGSSITNNGHIWAEVRYGEDDAQISGPSGMTKTGSGTWDVMAFCTNGAQINAASENDWVTSLQPIRFDLPGDGGTVAQRTLTLTDNVTIPKGMELRVTDWSNDDAESALPMILVVPDGKILTVNGSLFVGGKVEVQSGGALNLNDYTYINEKAGANMILGELANAGTVTVGASAVIDCSGSINTTGTFTNNGTIHLYSNSNTDEAYPQYGTIIGTITNSGSGAVSNEAVVTTEAELRTAMSSNNTATRILINGDITLGADLTITKPTTIGRNDENGDAYVLTTGGKALTVSANLTVQGELAAEESNVTVSSGATVTVKWGGKFSYYSSDAGSYKLTVVSGGRIDAIEGGELSFGKDESACADGCVVNNGTIEIYNAPLNIQCDCDFYTAIGKLVGTTNLFVFRANRSDAACKVNERLWSYLTQPANDDAIESWSSSYNDWANLEGNWDAKRGYAWLLTNGVEFGFDSTNGKLDPYGDLDYATLKAMLTSVATALLGDGYATSGAKTYIESITATGAVYTTPIKVVDGDNTYYTDALNQIFDGFITALNLECVNVTNQAGLYAALGMSCVREIHITANLTLNATGEGSDTQKYFTLSGSDGFDENRRVYVDSDKTLTVPSGVVLQVEQNVTLDINAGNLVNNGGVGNFGSIDCGDWDNHYTQGTEAWKNDYIQVIEFAKKVNTKLGTALTAPTDVEIKDYAGRAHCWPDGDDRSGAYAFLVKYGGVTWKVDENDSTNKNWDAYNWITYGETNTILGNLWTALGKEGSMPTTVTLNWPDDGWLMTQDSADLLVDLFCEAAGIGIVRVKSQQELADALSKDYNHDIHITNDITLVAAVADGSGGTTAAPGMTAGSDINDTNKYFSISRPDCVSYDKRTVYVDVGATLTVGSGVVLTVDQGAALDISDGKLVNNGSVNVFGELTGDTEDNNHYSQGNDAVLSFYCDFMEFAKRIKEAVGSRLTQLEEGDISTYAQTDNWPDSDDRSDSYALLIKNDAETAKTDGDKTWWEPYRNYTYGEAKAVFTKLYQAITDNNSATLPDTVKLSDTNAQDTWTLNTDQTDELIAAFAAALPQIENTTSSFTVSGTAQTFSGQKFTNAVAIAYSETPDSNGWGGDIRFENCTFEKGVTVTYSDAAGFAVNFSDSCTVTGVVSVVPGDSTTLWKNNNVDLRGAKGLTITAAAPVQVNAKSGGSFTLNGATVSGTCGEGAENWYSACVRYNCDGYHADSFNWETNDHSACVTEQGGSTLATTSPELQLNTGTDGTITAASTAALACNVRVEGNATISDLSVDSSHTITVSDNNHPSSVNIGTNAAYVYDNNKETGGYTFTGTGTVHVENPDANVTANGKSFGLPHVFGNSNAYSIYVGIGSTENLTFIVEQKGDPDTTLTHAVDTQYSEEDKIHLVKSGTETWITDANQVRLTIAVNGGCTVVYERLDNCTDVAAITGAALGIDSTSGDLILSFAQPSDPDQISGYEVWYSSDNDTWTKLTDISTINASNSESVSLDPICDGSGKTYSFKIVSVADTNGTRRDAAVYLNNAVTASVSGTALTGVTAALSETTLTLNGLTSGNFYYVVVGNKGHLIKATDPTTISDISSAETIAVQQVTFATVADSPNYTITYTEAAPVTLS